MKIEFSALTLNQYLNQLSLKEPVPGGGSAAALTAATGAALVSMVANYSIGRKANSKELNQKLKSIRQISERLRKRLLVLSSLDSQAYLKLVQARGKGPEIQKKASQGARAVPLEICKCCYEALDLIPYLVEHGNPYLLSDAKVAVELLNAGFNGAMVMVKVNS